MIIDLDPRRRGISKSIIALGALGLVGSIALSSCEPIPRVDGKINPQITTPGGRNFPSNLTEEDILMGLRARRDAITTFREFVPNRFLERGLVLDQDGPTYWAAQVRDRNVNEGEYILHVYAKMGEDGQDYAVALTYDTNDRLLERHIRAGRIPAFIRPDVMINPIPGFEWLSIPPDRLREVASQTYDLPAFLTWRETEYNGVPYMGPEWQRRNFRKLIATGEEKGRKFDFSIDEQSFSGLNVTEPKRLPSRYSEV